MLLAAALSLSACGATAPPAALDVAATIDGVSIDEGSNRDPLRLDPTEESSLIVTATNTTDGPVVISRVRLEGEMLGLNFLAYDVRVSVTVEPGATRAVEVPLDFFDLERQANGYLRAYIRTYGSDDQRLSSNAFALDIRGSNTSTMNVFALALLVLTVLSAAVNARDMVRHRLPSNRFVRGLRFMVPGVGLGLLLSAAFSILRVMPLPAAGWIPLTVLPALAGFAIGYLLTPGGDLDDDDLDDDDLDDAETIS